MCIRDSKLDEVEAICDTIVVIRDGKHIATTPMDRMDVNRIIAQMVGREMSQMYPTLERTPGEVVFEARNVTCWDVDRPERRKVDNVSFSLRRGEILGIAGLVGAGRTELVTALFGAYPGRCEAEVWLEGQRIDSRTPLKAIRCGLALVPEDRKHHGIVRGLKAKGVACVYISHKLDEVEAICDTIVVIRDGKHIATTPMDRMDVNQIIAQMVGREMSQMYPSLERTPGEVVFEARNVTCWDVDRPERRKVDNVSFSLRRGEILGIAGLVGAGRTELVTALFGAYPGRCEAEVWLEGRRIDSRTPLKAIRCGLALVPEDRKHHGIVRDMDVGQNITLSVLGRFARFTRIDREAELAVVSEEIARLGLKTASPFLSITSLSGGNQQKAVLSKMLLTRPKVLILDEPTRGVDVGAKFEIYKLMLELAAQGMSIIMVSSELAEVLGVSDRVLVMGEGKLRGDFVNDNLSQETVLAAALTH